MAQDKFDALPLDEKFKVTREDIRLVAAHCNQNQSDVAAMAQTISELRQEIQRLSAKVDGLSRKA